MLYGLPHQALEQVLPGFNRLTLGGCLIGLVWGIVCGLYAGRSFSAVYNGLHKRGAGG